MLFLPPQTLLLLQGSVQMPPPLQSTFPNMGTISLGPKFYLAGPSLQHSVLLTSHVVDHVFLFSPLQTVSNLRGASGSDVVFTSSKHPVKYHRRKTM